MEQVRAHGITITCSRAGSGPPLVLVHGAAGDHRSWTPQLQALAADFTVIAWDEPGAGGSDDVPEHFTVADYAHCLADLITHLGVGPANIVGLSWGGTLVIELYRHHPELVSRMVLADTYAGWKGSLPADEVNARVNGFHAALHGEKFDPTLPGLFSSGTPRQYESLLAGINAGVRRRSMAHALDLMAETDQRDVLPRIAVPTLLVWGAQDARSPLEIVGHQFELAIPGAQLAVIHDCGHMSNLEAPDVFNRLVREFCLPQA